MFQQALNLSPNDAGAVNGMGNVRFYQGNFDAALAMHRRALELEPGYSAAKNDPKSGSYPVADSQGGGLNGARVAAILSLT